MAREKNSVDVAVIGGGPAGISAALWCDELGLECVLIEQNESLGGQLHRIHNRIENYLGAKAENGAEMLSLFEKSVASRNFTRRTGIKAVSIDASSLELRLDGSDEAAGETLSCRAIIVATGVRRRRLDIPGEVDLQGKGILESGVRDKHLAERKRVMIVGGGDAAFENALLLSDLASSVDVVYRRDRPSARSQFVDPAKRKSNIRLRPMTVATAIRGNTWIEAVELKDSTGSVNIQPIDALLIRIGVEPNSTFLRGEVERDDLGYIRVDAAGRTSVANVYAVGDVANRWSPTLSTAAGTAATSVKMIYRSFKEEKGYNNDPSNR